MEMVLSRIRRKGSSTIESIGISPKKRVEYNQAVGNREHPRG